MNTLAALRSAWRALAAHPMRSLLTMLGVVIGVAAVITTLAIGHGAERRIAEQIASLGSNALIVLPGTHTANGVRLGAQTGQALTEEDAEAIAREVPEVQYAAPNLRSAVQIVAGNANWASHALGTTPDYLHAREWRLADGRVFEPAEQAASAKVVLLGRTVARELFGDADPIDQVVRINKLPLTVIGVLAPKGQNAWGQDQDDVLMLPISTYRYRVQGQAGGPLRKVGSVSVKVHEGMSLAAAEEGMRALLRQRHRLLAGEDDDFGIRNLTELMQTQQATGRVLALLLAAVAGVSLVVGGIGIMNIMLVSVTERTREIGLRMALGARSGDILAQFLIEAVSLSVLGGALGIALGAAASWAVAAFAGWPVATSGGAIALAAGFSAGVGVFFGYYPARRAARLQPMEALRRE